MGQPSPPAEAARSSADQEVGAGSDPSAADPLVEALSAKDPAVAKAALFTALRAKRFDLFEGVVNVLGNAEVTPSGGYRVGSRDLTSELVSYFDSYAQRGQSEATRVLHLLDSGPALRSIAAFTVGYLRGKAPMGSATRLRSALSKESVPAVAATIKKAAERVEAGGTQR
jgi:hypothetical protein